VIVKRLFRFRRYNAELSKVNPDLALAIDALSGLPEAIQASIPAIDLPIGDCTLLHTAWPKGDR
jgi:hypothetical protein